MQMLMMGILGEYLWRTLDESRRRPRFLIEGTTEKDDGTKRPPVGENVHAKP
jgi:dolichol-phosphate mannosyltransferase